MGGSDAYIIPLSYASAPSCSTILINKPAYIQCMRAGSKGLGSFRAKG